MNRDEYIEHHLKLKEGVELVRRYFSRDLQRKHFGEKVQAEILTHIKILDNAIDESSITGVNLDDLA